ncbi:MAG: chitosanase [Novosphingobium sp.]
MITSEQWRAIDSIVSIFETGKLPAAESYSTCTILPDGAGISYGKHQATARSGSLQEILTAYMDREPDIAPTSGPVEMAALLRESRSYSSEAAASAGVRGLMEFLRRAGTDPKMVAAQDAVFAIRYWAPAVEICRNLGLVTALSHLTVYDVLIQSDAARLAMLRNDFAESPPARGGNERKWTSSFNSARRAWLENFRSADTARARAINRSAYRAIALEQLCATGKWDLNLPLTVRGVTIPR